MVQHAGKVLTHQFLIRQVWGGGADVHNLRVHVRAAPPEDRAGPAAADPHPDRDRRRLPISPAAIATRARGLPEPSARVPKGTAPMPGSQDWFVRKRNDYDVPLRHCPMDRQSSYSRRRSGIPRRTTVYGRASAVPIDAWGRSNSALESPSGLAIAMIGWISGSFATRSMCWIPLSWARERYCEGNVLRHYTKSPKVNRSGEFGPERSDFRPSRPGPTWEPPRYNPRKTTRNFGRHTSGERVVLGGWRRNGNWGPTLSAP